MSQTDSLLDPSDVLTLEEIGNLAEGGKPAETLMNVVALIAQGSRPMCARSICWSRTAPIWCWPRAWASQRMHRHASSGCMKAWRDWSPNKCVRSRGAGRSPPALQIFQGSGRRFLSFLFRRADRRARRAARRSGGPNHPGADFPEVEIRMLTEAAAQVARWSARPALSIDLSRRLRRSSGRSHAICGGVGTRIRPACSATWTRCGGGQLNHNPISLLTEIPLAKLERRAGELVLHGRINYAYRRQQEYLQADRTWGATHAGVLRPRPVAYFSAEFGCMSPCRFIPAGLGVLAGDHVKSASDLDIPLVGVGLFYGQGYFRQRLDITGWQHEEYLPADVNQLPMERAIGTNGEPITIHIETRGGSDRRESVASESRALSISAAGFERRRQHPRGPRAHFALVWRRRPGARPSGIAAGRRRISRSQGHGHHSRRSSPERRT